MLPWPQVEKHDSCSAQIHFLIVMILSKCPYILYPRIFHTFYTYSSGLFMDRGCAYLNEKGFVRFSWAEERNEFLFRNNQTNSGVHIGKPNSDRATYFANVGNIKTSRHYKS